MRGRPVRRSRVPAARARDAKRATTAASLQQTCPSWLVIWSRYHQTYTAFACFTAEPTVVDEAQVEVFLQHIRQIELACASGQGARG